MIIIQGTSVKSLVTLEDNFSIVVINYSESKPKELCYYVKKDT